MKKILFLFFIFFCPGSFLYAGTTGKISGIVKDAQSGEALPGVNIVLTGTSIGAATNLDGFYFIINIPPGPYELEARMMGYETVRKTGVIVRTDLTTKVNFSLNPTVLEGQQVSVVAERPAIQKDLTSSLQSFSSQQMEAAPTENLEEIMELQAGINAADAGEAGMGGPGDGIHIRGGRENETLFLIDGIRVGDDIYGGSRYIQSTSGTSINEMKTIIGTFNAEYGGKMAGVISVVTKDGDPYYSAHLGAYTDHFGVDSYDKNTYQTEFSLSGPVPCFSMVNFFINGQIRSTDGRNDLHGVRIPNWKDFKGNIPRTTPGESVPLDWKDEWNGLAKLTWRPLNSIKLMISYIHAAIQNGIYRHEYKFLPYHNPFNQTTNDGVTLKLTHTLGPSTFYQLYGAYQRTDYFYGVDKVREKRLLLGSRNTTDEFYYSGAKNEYKADTSKTYTLGLDLTSQINSLHQIKAGFEGRFLDVFHNISEANGDPVTEYIIGVDENGIPIKQAFPNHIAWVRRYPHEYSGYLQDKMEFENIGMIMNAGIRCEVWDARMEYMQNPGRPMQTPMKDTNVKIRWSPRFGISYPVSDKAAFHLAYGHFYQFPSYLNLLSGLNDRGYYGNRPNLAGVSATISNPNSDPEKTVSYETGVQFRLGAASSLNVTAFYREMADLIGVRWMEGGGSGGYVYLENIDFGYSKGLEFTLEKRFSNFYSARINYTWSTSHISTSSPLTAIQKNQTLGYRTFLADWDRPHNLTALFLLSEPRNWAVSLRGMAKSGKPYTVLAEQLNTERMPWYITLDLRLSKYFHLLGFTQTVYVQVYNLLDRRNVYAVYPETGRWDDDGYSSTPPDADKDPKRISEGRSIRLGFKMDI